MALLSNAAMYNRTWAAFVDGAISKHHQKTSDGVAGNRSDGRVGSGRIDLQDVMRVEEILARIERAEGGWIDYERRPDGDAGTDADASSLASGSLLRSSGRKALDTLPPMFQNPGPSFLASMYNPAPVQAIRGKDRPLPNDGKASRSGAKERSYSEDKSLPVVGGVCPVSGSRSENNGVGGVGAAEDDQLCSSQTAVGRGDGAASEYEGRRQCLESRPGGPETKTEQRSIDLSELMESLRLDGTETGLSTPPHVRGQSEEPGHDFHREAQQPAEAEAPEGTASATSSSDLFGRNLSPTAAYEDEEMFPVSQKHTQDGSNGGGEQVVCPLEQEEEEKGEVRCVEASSSGTTPLRPDLFPEDVLMSQLSACLDATRIEGEETVYGGTTGAGEEEEEEEEEEQSPLYASPEDKSRMIGGVTVVRASPRGVGKSGANFSGDEEERLRGGVLSVERSGVKVGVTVLEGSGYGDSGSGSSRTDGSGEVVAAATAAALVEEDDDVLGAVDDSQCALVPTPLSGSSSSSSSSRGTAPVYDDAAAATRVMPSGAEGCRRSPLQLEFQRKVSAAGNGRNGDAFSGEKKAGADDDDLRDGDRSRFVGSNLHAPDKLLGLLSSPVGNDPTPASVSASAAGLTKERPSPHHEPSSQGDARLERRVQAGDTARVDEQAESPEILRLGPASPDRERMIRHEQRPSLDRGSWEARDVGGDPHGGGVAGNNGASFTLGRSPGGASTRGSRQDQRLGSMLSPDTEGVGFLDGTDGVSSLSPFVLAGSFDAADMGDAGYGSDGGSGWALPPGGGDGDCGLSPVRSATSETTDDVPSPPQGSGTPSSALPLSGEDKPEDEDTTLTPEVAPRLSSPESPIMVSAGSRLEEEEGGDPGWGNVDIEGGQNTHKQVDAGSLMPPPPPRYPPFSPRCNTLKCRERAFSRNTPDQRCSTQSSAADTRVVPLRTALGDRTNAPPRGRCDGRSDEEDSPPVSTRDGGRYDGGSSGARGCGGGRRRGVAEYSEQASIDSFSESDPERSKPGVSAKEAGADEDMTDGSSLAEGTPRRRGAGARDCSLGGFYPPLQVANLANKAREGLTLSTLQESTLQWMLWRERGEKGGRSATAAGASVSDDDDDDAIDIKGGLLGHLPSEEASACLHALVRAGVTFNDGDGSGREVGSRARRTHTGTGLPCGPTLVLAPTKDAAWRWSDRLESGSGGLSVLSYVMPLRERRRLSAKQVAAFDVVVTTYDVLKAKEVPRGVEARSATSPRSWALPGSTQWRTRNDKEAGQKRSSSAASKTDHMVSLLHGVWWDRVVADGAQILATQRSARAVAALALMGTTRWCLVDCESMSVVEDASERMRCLAAFLRVPAAVPLVEVAESLFYRSRPRHIAPLYPRAPGAADNSLSLTEGDDSSGCSLRHRRRSSRGINTRRGGRRCVEKRGSGREGRPSEEGKRLSTMEEVGDGGGGWGALPIDGGRSQRTSHAETRGRRGRREASPENGERRHDGGGDRKGQDDRGAGRQFSRGDVTYVPSRLRLRRARGETGPMQVDQK